MISLTINTCALQARESISSGRVSHKWRQYALRNWILPQYIADPYIDEVIVVGSWEEGEGYIYLPCPSKHFNAADALEQRQMGFEQSEGDVLIFQHDDHMLDLFVFNNWMMNMQVAQEKTHPEMPADVIIPMRHTRARNIVGERLNNGEDMGYISGHCTIYRREVIEKCPWNQVHPSFTTMGPAPIWDMYHTAQILEAEFKVVRTDGIKVWDVELGAEPWK